MGLYESRHSVLLPNLLIFYQSDENLEKTLDAVEVIHYGLRFWESQTITSRKIQRCRFFDMLPKN
jgi:hypothetical protein